MAQNMLKELLKQDQEPFHLKDYIANKQHQLNKKQTHHHIQLNKPKPLSRKHPPPPPSSSSFFCRNPCFFSLRDTHEMTKSPLFEFTRSPCNKSPNRIFLNVPAKTSSLLLEAAMRIQKQNKPNKENAKNSGLGLFGSVLKRLTTRKRSGKIEESKMTIMPSSERVVKITNGGCSNTNTTTTCSSLLSLSSLDEVSCSSSGRSINGGCDDDDDDEFVFSNVLKDNDNNNNNGSSDYGLCLSPLSPFRFALCSSPSPEKRSPPVKSPLRDDVKENVKYEEGGSIAKFQVEEDEEEDKEQNSPVSVLDPPFEDDYDVHEEEEEEYDLECSYAFVQRAKHHLLHKLQRFEKLAELDPIELEKRLIEDEVDNEEYDYESFNFDDETQIDKFIDEIITKSEFRDIRKSGIKRLISDLIMVEDMELIGNEENVVKWVCKRLESWNEVEANTTIDMMVGMDLRKEIRDWKCYKVQIDEIAKDFEVGFFAVLVDELVNDLIR